jgi:mannosyltransferase OCH1-like enzyme
MIPRWIHQTWKTKDPNVDAIRATWVNNHQDFRYSFYDDDDIDIFIQRHFDKRVYRNYKGILNGSLKADFFRYCVLYVHGGVYVDVDIACLAPLHVAVDFELDTLVTAADYQERDYQPINMDYRRDCVYQAFLCCHPFHPLMKYMINYMCFVMENHLYPRDIFRIGGPEAFADAYDRVYRNVLPNKYHLREANNGVLPGGIKMVSHLHECEYLGYNGTVFARCQLPLSRKETTHYSNEENDLYKSF